MSFNWDWNTKPSSWREQKNIDNCDKRTTATNKGEINMTRRRRQHEGEDRDCYEINTCDRNVHRSYEVSLPITITPYALPGEPDVCCGGDARVRRGHKRCDNNNKGHEFTVSQIINIEIPIEFGAKICYEDYCSEERNRCNDEEQNQLNQNGANDYAWNLYED